MPDNPTGPEEPLDVTTIRHLVRLMKRYDLTAIDFIEGETKIRLRRRTEMAPAQSYAPQPSASPAFAATLPPRAEAPTAAPVAPAGVVIESPMVGTYYASSAPDAPPFVSVGTAVRPDSTVCVIEAMKVFTEIPAQVSGTITEVLVKNGQSVEFGQPMFRVNPS
jgi:acetyl-CoA carboxylase biotin carboxyl carrier protein